MAAVRINTHVRIFKQVDMGDNYFHLEDFCGGKCHILYDGMTFSLAKICRLVRICKDLSGRLLEEELIFIG